jgi:hypothetical protein
MIDALIVAGSLGLSWPTLPEWLKPRKIEPSETKTRLSPNKVYRKIYEQKGWIMMIQNDGFSGEVRCHLYSPSTLFQGRITYAQKTLGFEFDEDIDTLRSWYRIDSQGPRRWQDSFPDLASRRVPLEGKSLENPTGGVVLIPEEDVLEARQIWIRTHKNKSPKRFKLKGFKTALAAAQRNGCTSEDSFERTLW